MKQKAKILFFCMIFVVGGVFGQKNYSLNYISTLSFNKRIKDSAFFSHSFSTKKMVAFSIASKNDSMAIAPFSFLNTTPINVIAANYYTQNFGFFCKKELQLQKAIKVPFVFRLGSVEMCDRLEGKGK